MQESRKSIWNPAFMSNVQQQGFKNPWNQDSQSSNAPARRQSSFLQLPTTYEELDDKLDQDEQFRRRNSSLIIPPTRAAGPDPFLYENQLHQLPPLHKEYQPYGNQFYRRQSVNVAGTYQLPVNAAISHTFQHQLYPSCRKLSAYPISTDISILPPHIKQLQTPPLTTQTAPPILIPQMRNVSSRHDLQPIINSTPKFRRASLNSKTISPLIALTKSLITTYSLCSSEFQYQTSKNPRRVLTTPSEGKCNNGYDNVNSDYILYVNDVLGLEQNRKYLVLDILGQGTFGQVVKCQNLITKEILAVKVIKSKTEYLNQSITEAKILELINRKIDPLNKHHFLRLHDTFIHKNHLCLVFEILSNNLYELLRQNQFHGLPLNLIKNFAKQLLDSLCILKDNKLIHCDLKPENILLVLPDKPELKVIDFGSACEETRTIYTYIQSRFYRAPEIIMGIPYSTSIDMWSFGCIIAELFLGIPIFPGSSEFDQMSQIVSTLGLPPTWMCEMGKNSSNFLEKIDPALKTWRLKTLEEYNQEYHANELPSKEYFKWKKMPDIIRNYRISKKISSSPSLVSLEMQERECLIHFLTGVLNLNPLERWTPQQASMHPFITGHPFDKEWYPPGLLLTRNIRQPSLPDKTAREFNKLQIEDSKE